MPPFAQRIAALPKWQGRGAAFVCGVFLASIQAPLGFFPAFFLSIPVLFWLISGATGWRHASWIGWFAGVGYFGAGLHWIVEPFFVDPLRHGWLSPFAILGMSGGLALFWALAFASTHLVAKGFLLAPALAVTLTLAELLRSYVLTGFPWNLLGYGWLDTPVAQLAALVGPHVLGLATVLVGGVVAMAWRGWPVWIAALSVLAGWGYGNILLQSDTAERADPLIVRLVQPNAPQTEKWTAEGMRAQYLRGLLGTAAPGEYDVVIWPEVSVPQLVDEPARQYGQTLFQWSDISTAANGKPALVGARQRRVDPSIEWFNTLAVLQDATVTDIYKKYHLVPFGEYIPLAEYLPGLGMQGLASALSNLGGSMSGGEGPLTLSTADLPPFLPLICYEAIFPHQMRAAGERPEWLVNITNDAWFGEFVGPYQHLAQARFRAIEQGLPMARAANTGVSAMIGPDGEVLASIPLGQHGFVDAALPAPKPPTLYSQTGDRPAIILLLLAFLGFAAVRAIDRLTGKHDIT
ncbi:MAG: apolipoprotein N-acyltransferase [Pseudomonadota bacterium]